VLTHTQKKRRRYWETDRYELKQTLSVAQGSQPKPGPLDTMSLIDKGRPRPMKKLFLASIAFITLNVGISALAADMPIKAPPVGRAAPPSWSGFYIAAPPSWSGFYIGAHVGYGWGARR
jgi:hypothetical protein